MKRATMMAMGLLLVAVSYATWAQPANQDQRGPKHKIRNEASIHRQRMTAIRMKQRFNATDEQWRLSTTDIFDLAATLAQNNDLRKSKIGVLAFPGEGVDSAEFLETCSVNRGMNVDTFSNYEDAIQWFFTTEEVLIQPPNKPIDSDSP